MKHHETKNPKMPIIVKVNIVLFVLGIITTIMKLSDLGRFNLSLQYLGGSFTYFDYGMDLVLLLAAAILIYGLFKAKKWAWNLTFIIYAVYLLGKIIGVILGYVYFDEVMEMSSILKYGEIRQIDIPKELTLIIGSVAVFVQGLIITIICWFHYKAKPYFKN